MLIYTAGHINYGGRITDDWDRRCVLTILRDFYRQEILSSSYQFDEEGRYVQVCIVVVAWFYDAKKLKIIRPISIASRKVKKMKIVGNVIFFEILRDKSSR